MTRAPRPSASRRRAPARSALRALADRLGILPDFLDHAGTRRVPTSDDTRVAILAAMGIDAGDDAAARRALEELDRRDAARLLPPVRVVTRPESTDPRPVTVPLTLPPDARGEWALALREEGGVTHRAEGRLRPARDGSAPLPLPVDPPLGYHELRVEAHGPGWERASEQTLVVAPPSCPSPERLLRRERVAGLTASLYTVRSARNWGVGDFTDLGELLAFARDAGAAFVGLNPLHALRNRGGDVSPYSPVSRLHRNVLYLDVEAIPELALAPDARELVASPAFGRELARLRDARQVDYAAVTALKRPVLELLHAAFRRAGAGGARAAAYERWIARQGRALEDFATFCALEEHFAGGASGDGAGSAIATHGELPVMRPPGSDGILSSGGGPPAPGAPASWRTWPEPFRDPASPAVAAFRRSHADRVDLHRWLQFELDRQLGAAAARGRALGLPVGLYQDLAIGSAADGSDTWAFPSLFLSGISVGAPPDAYSATGQNWGLPPVDPRRLAERRYDYWVALVRSALAHAGALRIDHVMGLFRQFWIPEGKSGTDGAYVRFPADDLLGILALESRRAGALVVGEDLGVVPPEVPPALERWSMLSSRVLYFERDGDGAFRPAGDYPRMALATANTHDLPTLAGFWRGRDLELRGAMGLHATPAEERAARRARVEERAALLARLRADALLPPPDGTGDPDELTLRAAVHAFLRRTPSWLVGLSLEDLVGEAEPVNVPGVGPDRFPSWTRRLAVPLETLREDAAVWRALGLERRWVPSPGTADGAPPARVGGAP